MATFSYYGILAVDFSSTKKHPHFISRVLIIEVDTDGTFYGSGKPYTKAEAIKLKPLHTMVWDYNTGKWSKGASVGTEVVNGVTYLRSRRNDTETDNLSHLLEIRHFF